MKILAISGSLRRESNNTRLLRALAEEAPAGVTVEQWDGLREIPPYDQDEDATPGPQPVEELRRAIADADAVLFATPEYNSSVPGALKNALDWASRPFATSALRNKPVAVIASSAGAFGGVWAGAELRKVLGASGARVAEVEMAVGHADQKFDADGELVDGEVRQQLHDAIGTLVDEVDQRLQVAA